jgi:hypothetical protein
MSLVRLFIITDCCLLAALLIATGILMLLKRHDGRRAHGESRGRHEQQGRHRRESNGVPGVSGSVAALREREHADELRYYPGRER